MRERGVDPLRVTGDDLRVYKAALLAAGKTPTTVAARSGVIGVMGLLPVQRS
jgi:hypothetical protein